MAIVTKTDITNGAIYEINSVFNQITIQSLFSFINDQYASYFTQEFDYSVNGGTSWVGYQSLTENNIRAVSADVASDLVVRYKYVRTATPASGDEVNLRGLYSELIYPFYDNTFLRDFFELNDSDVFNWSLNLLEKFYDRGQLAFYLDRRKDYQLFDDEDFLSFWHTVTHFFALVVVYARQYSDIRESEVLLKEFFNSIGLFYNRNNDLTELQYLFDNYITEFQYRGTSNMNNRKSDGYTVNGEMLRLIDYFEFDEYVFCLCGDEDIGWNLGNSSPMFRGTQFMTNMIKEYEYTEEVQSLDNYPLVEDSYITLENDCIKITGVPVSTESGIGPDGTSDFLIPINPNLDYEVSFKISKDQLSDDVSFGIQAYDFNGDMVDLVSNVDSSTTNWFFQNKKVVQVLGTEYWVRGVIFSNDTVDNPDDKTNLSYGNNLKFDGYAVAYIVPKILVDSLSVSHVTYICDIKIRPREIPFSQGYLGAKNFIINFLTNRSGLFNDKITNLVKKYLIPYNSTYYPYYLPYSSFGTSEGYLLLNSGGYVLLNSGGKLIIK